MRSLIAAPVVVAGDRRGVLQAAPARVEAFSAQDVAFLEAATRWSGALTHRAELAALTLRQAVEQERRTIAEDLITVLAHDLNNLLMPLLWHIQMISRRATREQRPADERDASEAIMGLRRLSRLVSNLLDLTRLDRGLFELAPVLLDVGQLVRESVGLFGARSGAVRIEETESRELLARADPDRLRQVIENLLANALKHSPPDRQVTVRVAREARADGDWVAISVSDQGPGIPPHLLPRIFERYSAGPDSHGLGLGLYLASRIAEAHGGSLRVSSLPGHGARFDLAIPGARTEQERSGASALLPLESSAAPAQLDGRAGDGATPWAADPPE